MISKQIEVMTNTVTSLLRILSSSLFSSEQLERIGIHLGSSSYVDCRRKNEIRLFSIPTPNRYKILHVDEWIPPRAQSRTRHRLFACSSWPTRVFALNHRSFLVYFREKTIIRTSWATSLSLLFLVDLEPALSLEKLTLALSLFSPQTSRIPHYYSYTTCAKLHSHLRRMPGRLRISRRFGSSCLLNPSKRRLQVPL